MIPKILHYVWAGPNPLPKEAEALIARWRAIMPDYKVMVWGNEDILKHDSQFLRLSFAVGAWNRVANYLRICALIEHGGIYLDTDMDVLKSFDPLLDNQCFFGIQRDDSTVDLVNNAVIGAVPNHPFLNQLRDALDQEFVGYVDVSCGSGPGLVSVKLAEKGLDYIPEDTIQIEGITIYSKDYFYPYKWDEEYSEECITPNTYAVHLWDHTWGGKKSTLQTIIKKMRKYLWLQFVKIFPKLGFEFSYKAALHRQTNAV